MAIARSHPAPKWTAAGGFFGSAGTHAECLKLSAQVMKMSAEIAIAGKAGEICDNGGVSWGCGGSGGSPGLRCSAYEGDPKAMKAFLQPLADWANAQGGTIKGSVHAGVNWNNTGATFGPEAHQAGQAGAVLESCHFALA
jgi:hypothetical protein